MQPPTCRLVGQTAAFSIAPVRAEAGTTLATGPNRLRRNLLYDTAWVRPLTGCAFHWLLTGCADPSAGLTTSPASLRNATTASMRPAMAVPCRVGGSGGRASVG